MENSKKVIGVLKSCPAVKRCPHNPVLSAKDVPYPASLVFNAGVARYNGKYVMIFRNDRGDADKGQLPWDTKLGLAFSADGVKWRVEPKPCFIMQDRDIKRSAYDPRLTVIDGRCYVCFALTCHHGIRAGIAVTDDFENFEVLSLTVPDNRNMVLFPEKINNMYVRLERPFSMCGRGGRELFDIWISESPDLKYWGNSRLLLTVEDVPFANAKIGPAAPPLKTDKGWLVTFHAVDVDPAQRKNGWEETWNKRYTAGIMLLELENPGKIIGFCKEPLFVPEASYEIEGGFRNNIVFPGGLVLEGSGEVKIYYGAADAVECLATAHVDDLLKLCVPL